MTNRWNYENVSLLWARDSNPRPHLPNNNNNRSRFSRRWILFETVSTTSPFHDPCQSVAVWSDWATFKVLADKFPYKSSPNMCSCFLGYLDYPNLKVKTAVASFVQLFENFMATYYFNIWSHFPHWISSICHSRTTNHLAKYKNVSLRDLRHFSPHSNFQEWIIILSSENVPIQTKRCERVRRLNFILQRLDD